MDSTINAGEARQKPSDSVAFHLTLLTKEDQDELFELVNQKDTYEFLANGAVWTKEKVANFLHYCEQDETETDVNKRENFYWAIRSGIRSGRCEESKEERETAERMVAGQRESLPQDKTKGGESASVNLGEHTQNKLLGYVGVHTVRYDRIPVDVGRNKNADSIGRGRLREGNSQVGTFSATPAQGLLEPEGGGSLPASGRKFFVTFVVGVDARGKGIGVRALQEGLAKFHEKMPHVSEVFADVHEGNERSVRALRKAGFANLLMQDNQETREGGSTAAGEATLTNDRKRGRPDDKECVVSVVRVRVGRKMLVRMKKTLYSLSRCAAAFTNADGAVSGKYAVVGRVADGKEHAEQSTDVEEHPSKAAKVEQEAKL